MINIIFDENLGSFFFTCKEEKDMSLEEELIVITQKIFALYAANIPGDSVEAFKKMASYITDVYEDPDCREVLEDLYEANQDTIFLNDESTEDAMKIILKSLISDLDEMDDEEDKAMVELITSMYCMSMGLDMDKLREAKEEKDDNEDDLF